jgi:hypothetical protein
MLEAHEFQLEFVDPEAGQARQYGRLGRNPPRNL